MQAENERRIRKIFKECFELVDKYKNGVKPGEWKEIADLCAEKSGRDEFAGMMYAACYQELARISRRITE